jgi:hypothetical protein
MFLCSLIARARSPSPTFDAGAGPDASDSESDEDDKIPFVQKNPRPTMRLRPVTKKHYGSDDAPKVSTVSQSGGR